jgi:hypothetical protein
MTTYAQNNVQLLNAMRQQEYSQSDMAATRDAYNLAVTLFACRIESSGRVFLSHIVRTAGILVAVRAPLPLVLAGLLHNVYHNGDFGDGIPGRTEAKRAKVRAVVGQEAEYCIVAFAAQPWGAKAILALRDQLQDYGADSLSIMEFQGVMLRLADHLEHTMDLDPLYVPGNPYEALTRSVESALSEIATLLSYPLLAEGLQCTARELQTAQVAAQLCSDRRHSSLFIPASYCKRFPAAARESYFRTRRSLAALRASLTRKFS